MGLRLKKHKKVLMFVGSTAAVLALVVPLLTYGIITFNISKEYTNTSCYYDGYNITNQPCDGQTYTGVLLYHLYYNKNTIYKNIDIVCSDNMNDIKNFFTNYTKEWECWYSPTNSVLFKPPDNRAPGMIVGGTLVLALYISMISIYLVIKERSTNYQTLYDDEY